MVNVKSFIEKFQNDKVANTKIAPDAVSNYLKKELEIKTYIPFRIKREIAEMIVAQNIDLVDGIKKYDSVNAYISFIIASLTAHTSLHFGDNPVEDYDLLAESGLLSQIISEFEASHTECEIILKMVRDMELEDNNVNAIVARFTTGILDRLDSVGGVLKDKLGNLDLNDILGADFKQEDLAKLRGFLNKFN